MPEPIELSQMEIMALTGFAAKEREVNAGYVQFCRLIETSHGLESGDIGRKYLIDLGTNTLIPKPEPE